MFVLHFKSSQKFRHHGLHLAGDDQPQTNQPYDQAGG